ncbi:NADH-quinone oxidoreductase subunit L [Humisphaera borealis]|uniref:NADH-quinone oxidoreductase subunit L n=1 Tax=Humisphaera borealis TaxID=2807512 RepID=A0A7M2WVS8_9BACT|nr:NADH-quinone oxidoreductase subunit L [Humisphaera borealis]QOV89657.1 NADH-quinone oxidoreductase subunit L [Humisphaera borealis]
MPTPATILLIAALLPLASFVLLLFVGNRMGTPVLRMGTALAGWVATVAIGGSFVCSLVALYHWYGGGSQPAISWGYGKRAINISTGWLPTGPQDVAATAAVDHPGWLDVGIYIDGLTISMFLMVTLVALMVHIFSIGYMRGDIRFPRFFTYLSLFCASMLGLLLSSTLLQLFMFWELVGLCSYLLIGFWFERKSAARAALKAFVVNRIGDFAFLVGFGLLFYWVGNASLPYLWANFGSAGQGGDVTLLAGGVVPASAMTVIGVCLFFGAVGKSAQFPLHTWLPDAMEGPTPVSALIHAATMVAAGVYLMGRMFPLLTPDARLFIAIIGCITLLIGGLVAIVQTDIKRILAYSTISQLGYMMLAIGVGSWVGGLFHLITHAFFKALLFLGAGSVIHAAHHEQDIRQYGGLWHRIPVTAAALLIGVFAIAGAGVHLGGFEAGLSGYYSKTNILTDAAGFAILAGDAGRSSGYWLLFGVPAAMAFVTPFYMTRLWVLTFLGKPRNELLHEKAHESPMMYVPLLGLAAMSCIAGSELGVPDLLQKSIGESSAEVNRLTDRVAIARHAPADTRPTDTRAPNFGGWSTAWRPMQAVASPRRSTESVELSTDIAPSPTTMSVAESARDRARGLESRAAGWAWAIGIIVALVLYRLCPHWASRLSRIPPVSWIHAWLKHAMYFDELYDILFVRPIRFMASFAGWLDRTLVDGTVNLVASSTIRLSRVVGWHDRRIVDGAVSGVAQAAWEIGVAARMPQTGRIRFYVSALMLVIVIGLAVTVAVMMLR